MPAARAAPARAPPRPLQTSRQMAWSPSRVWASTGRATRPAAMARPYPQDGAAAVERPVPARTVLECADLAQPLDRRRQLGMLIGVAQHPLLARIHALVGGGPDEQLGSAVGSKDACRRGEGRLVAGFVEHGNDVVGRPSG